MSPGHDAVLRCEGHVPQVTFELLRAGETVATVYRADHSSADLVLTYVGPQHAGNYSCRYRSWWPRPFLSQLSNLVELQVAGDVPLRSEGWFLPSLCQGCALHRQCPSLHLSPAHLLMSLPGCVGNFRQGNNTCKGPEAEWLGQVERRREPGPGGLAWQLPEPLLSRGASVRAAPMRTGRHPPLPFLFCQICLGS